MEISSWILVSFGQTKIDNVDQMTSSTHTHQKVIRFDVSVNERSGMDEFQAGKQLIGEEQYGFETKLTIAIVEEILKGWAQ